MNHYILLLTLGLLISCSESGGQADEIVIETNFDDDTVPDDKPYVPPDVIEIVPGGDHKEYHPNGALKIEGQYDMNSVRRGLWISYYENGLKWSESYYVNGIQDGHSLTFYPNGKIRYVGEYRQGERIGEWRFYDDAGNLTQTEDFSKE